MIVDVPLSPLKVIDTSEGPGLPQESKLTVTGVVTVVPDGKDRVLEFSVGRLIAAAAPLR